MGDFFISETVGDRPLVAM